MRESNRNVTFSCLFNNNDKSVLFRIVSYLNWLLTPLKFTVLISLIMRREQCRNILHIKT